MTLHTKHNFGAGVITSAILSLCTVLSPYAYAETLQNPLSVTSLAGLIKTFVEMFSYFVIILAVLAFIWVGFQFILAQGKPDKLKELKSWLAWIAIGVAIVIGAQIMINIIINTLEATGVVSQQTVDTLHSASGN